MGLSLASLLASNLGVLATAATPSNIASNNANTLKISPVRTDLDINAGSQAKVTVYITNITKAPILLNPIENDFVSGDEKGTPSIILDENSYAPTHSLKRFMQPLQDITVAAGTTQQVDVTIIIPKTAQAGGYFGAIRFAPASIGGGKSVNLSASVASLILVTVPGALVENMSLTNFDVQQYGGTSSNFRTPDNLELLVRFKNDGNVQQAPFGQINLLKGNKIVFTNNFNGDNPKDTVLPDSSRRWSIPLKGMSKFGKYTITGNFTYGTKGQSVEVKKTFWIIPSTYIFIGVGIIGVIVILIIVLVLFLKSYKKRILRSSRRR